MSDENIAQLQLLEQNMQQFLMQKQHFSSQLSEIEGALDNLKGQEKAYKIVANIMVQADVSDLEKDLKEKKEKFELRLQNIEKQEKALQDKAETLRKEVMKGLQDGRNSGDDN